MHDADLVRGFERVGNLSRNRDGIGCGHRTARNPRRQVLARYQLHHEGPHTSGFLESVNLRDVGMIQRGERLGLSRESGDAIGVTAERVRENLQGDVAVEFRVTGAIDLAHSAGADGRNDRVRSEASPRVQRQEFLIARSLSSS